jgi:hypothetical protein
MEFSIFATWKMSGPLRVEAETFDEALEKVKALSFSGDVRSTGRLIPGSIEIDEEVMVEINMSHINELVEKHAKLRNISPSEALKEVNLQFKTSLDKSSYIDKAFQVVQTCADAMKLTPRDILANINHFRQFQSLQLTKDVEVVYNQLIDSANKADITIDECISYLRCFIDSRGQFHPRLKRQFENQK